MQNMALSLLKVATRPGMRSRGVAQSVVQDGFRKVYNLKGGIDAWSVLVDPSVAQY